MEKPNSEIELFQVENKPEVDRMTGLTPHIQRAPF